MRASFIALIAALLLSGCMSAERQAEIQRQQAEQESYQREQYRQSVFSQCDRMGFSRGTDAHANCVLQTHNQNIQSRDMVLQQAIQQERQRQLMSMPYCSSLPPGQQGYQRAQGTCR